jgi:hypothetical protein
MTKWQFDERAGNKIERYQKLLVKKLPFYKIKNWKNGTLMKGQVD